MFKDLDDGCYRDGKIVSLIFAVARSVDEIDNVE